MTFEEKIKELENITEQLGKGDLSLEESLKFFEKGMKLHKECEKQLNKYDEKVQKLISIDENENIETENIENAEKEK